MKKILPFIFAILAASATWLPARSQRQAGQMEMRPEQKLATAEQIIERFYVDSVGSDKIVEEAIVAMLKTLDPHSTYSDPEETKELTTPLEGNFSGIGIQFNMLNDTLFVIQTTSGGPSEKVGILPGDRILQAGDSLISGVKSPNARVIRILRGPKGSQVNLKVLRKGVADPIEFLVTRDDIPVYSIDAAYMAAPGIGYIRMSRFAEDTPREFDEAVKKLKKQGMTDLIIDLEDNGGGYLNSAHEVASNFLNKGDLVVYTEAPKLGRHLFEAERKGDLTDGRVVVLVNQYSASASEILAGALQDNDRGVIVGRRTFGKGLVQRPFPFPDGSMIRLTVSRYFTPSGRCIQKPFEAGNTDDYRLDMLHRYQAGEFSSADSIHLPDSLRFETLRNHRTVYGGGGIVPDRFVAIDTAGITPYYRDLMAKGLLNRFAINYVDNNREQLKADYPDEQGFLDNFIVGDEIITAFTDLGVAEGVTPEEKQFEESRQLIATILKAIIGRDLFDTATYFKVVNPALNPIYTEGVRLLQNPDEYDALLQ